MPSRSACLDLRGFSVEHHAAAGCTAADVVSAVIYLTDINSLDTVDGVWQEFFTDPLNYPSRAVVEVSALVLGIQLEISGIAVKDQP